MSVKDILAEVIRRPARQSGAPPDARVPCGSCRRCCQGNSIVMLLAHEGDAVETYQHEYVDLPGAGRGPILKRQANGDCIYLGETGCTIHGRAPVVCKVFDCRNAFMTFMEHAPSDRRRLVKSGALDKDILNRGRDLLEGRHG
jgi:hypothetical protein